MHADTDGWVKLVPSSSLTHQNDSRVWAENRKSRNCVHTLTLTLACKGRGRGTTTSIVGGFFQLDTSIKNAFIQKEIGIKLNFFQSVQEEMKSVQNVYHLIVATHDVLNFRYNESELIQM